MSTAAAYASVINSAQCQVTTANTTRDGTGAVVTLVTGATNGTRVDDIYIAAAGTTTAGVVRMFLSDGTNHRLMQEFLISAVTPSTTVGVWSMFLPNLGILLKSGWSLRFSTNNTETFNILMTRGGDF